MNEVHLADILGTVQRDCGEDGAYAWRIFLVDGGGGNI
jgi:hypothetical protein